MAVNVMRRSSGGIREDVQIAAICQEAGMLVVRNNRNVILPKDFEKCHRSNVKKPDSDFEFYKYDCVEPVKEEEKNFGILLDNQIFS
ncbi:26S proteasome regulatory subunitB [Sesamum angolense]|uniref:26S proteasome regulatory subunitB n=1 Tax=Sesamum angolense TaxID=2727404 RepID=A0AAE1T9U8_9LAMI|nr:26S proteasome regulatory subunitB [Sesamum angolense]